MADVLQLRSQLDALTAEIAPQQQIVDTLQTQLDDLSGGEIPHPQPLLAALREKLLAAERLLREIIANRDAAKVAYLAAVAADPLHTVDAGVPLLLLPVRIETAYLPTAQGFDLAVRVYPDDIHVDSHETELTQDELVAGTAYWSDVWGAGTNAARLADAWRAILGRLKPARAAWTVEALRPAAARPPTETPVDQPQPVPTLTPTAARSRTFSRPARTTLLPDHWRVIGLRGGQELFYVDGLPIADALDISFGPPGTGGAAIDGPFAAGSRWLVDLDAAVAAGMAVRIPVTWGDPRVDQLFVIGVSTATASDEAARRIEAMFTAHQYTKGLGMLPPGTPTNNTAATRSGWVSASEPPAPDQVDTARADYVATGTQNAALLAAALGIDGSRTLCIAPHALDDQQSAITALAQQLWPALGGPALSRLFTSWDIPAGGAPGDGLWVNHVNAAVAAMLEEHAGKWVRSRGMLPILRIGRQPYGVLPVCSLSNWVAAADDPTSPLVQWLLTMRDYWLAGIAAAPHVESAAGAPGADPAPLTATVGQDQTVIDIFSQVPVSERVMVRGDGDAVTQAVSGQPVLAPVPGLPVMSEALLSTPALDATPLPIAVTGDPAADQGLFRIWQGLIADSVAVLQKTMAYADWVKKYQAYFGVGTPPGSPPATLFTAMLQDSLTDPLQLDVTVGFIVFAALFYGQKSGDPDFQKQVAEHLPAAVAYSERFTALCAIDPAAYDAAFREILDVFSYRLDAWITSLATRRIASLRAAKPAGVAIGAFGWVEALAPRVDLTPANPVPAGYASAFTSSKNSYVHAPSLQHAATAAVLRAGYDSHHGSDVLGVNLTSRRVRIADWLAGGIRNGQPLGALLGYRFERGLHEAGLDGLIEGLRAKYPQPLPDVPEDAVGAAADLIKTRSVVDGLALVHDRVNALAPFSADALAQLTALVDDAADALDALGDLLLAESVHHLVGGNPLRAGLSADTIGRGEPVPDRFDFVRTPRSGVPLTWQVGAAFPAGWRSSNAGWVTNRPRAAVAPLADAWAAQLLGPANSWQMVCAVTSGAGVTTATVGLDSLGLCALDAVAESSGEPSVLEQRIIDAVLVAQPAATSVTVVRTPANSGTLGYAEFASFAQRLRELLATATPLGAQHVEGAATSPGTGIDQAEFFGRAQALRISFGNSVAALATAVSANPPSIAGLRQALITIADHGIAPAYPASGDVATLASQAAAILTTVTPLAAGAVPAEPPADATPGAVAQWSAAVRDDIASITGRAVPIFPTFTLPAGSQFSASFAPAAAPVGADSPAVMTWLRRVARIRPKMRALHDVLLATANFGNQPLAFSAAQLPVEAAPQWAALPFAPGAGLRARVATVLDTPAPIDPTTTVGGLIADSWTEHVPGLTSVAEMNAGTEAAEVTGLAFRVESPEAYPPQSLLLAVAPDPSSGWSIDVLLAIVRETLDLAKMRVVDLGALPRLGRVLPAAHSGSAVDSALIAAGLTA